MIGISQNVPSTEVIHQGNLAKRIKEGKLEDNFTAREVHRKGWELLTEIETVNGALTDLVEANWLR